jgi:adenosylcobinamide-phosphate synthase
MVNFLAVAIAIFLDRLFGEPRIYHPLKGFTRIATYVEDHWHQQLNITKHTPERRESFESDPSMGENPLPENRQLVDASKNNKVASQATDNALKIKGIFASISLVLPFVGLAGIISQSLPNPFSFVFNTFVLYLAIGAHNLKQHVFDVQNALIADNLEMARKNLAAIVNRDTKHMDKAEIISTSVESIVENGSEMILAPIFWFLIIGAPGAVLCSLVHTLNVMWGFKDFGWAVGKANDILNWVPSRITAFSYILLGDMKNGWHCLNEQAKNWNSPNSELVVATGAGALNLELGGDLYYQEQLKPRSKFGKGKASDLSDIARASDLVERSMILWLAFILVTGFGH